MATEVLKNIEGAFFPFPEVSIWENGGVAEEELCLFEKITFVVKNCLQFIANLSLLPFASIYSLGKYLFSPVQEPVQLDPIQSDVNPMPDHFGFADSIFQTTGIGTDFSPIDLPKAGDWNDWIRQGNIEGSDQNHKRFFTDVLTNPTPFVQILKEQGVTAHRFSLEWSVIEPVKGQINEQAIDLYQNFIRELRENGIEPYVTIHHFTCPEWFMEEGGFTKLENVETFNRYALAMIEAFPEVSHWMPFNEINVDAFQKYIRGVYPPGEEGEIALAAKAMRNMLIAHCQIYKKAKERSDGLQIGSSHQWLKFEPLENNPLEKLICYFLSKITHYAVLNFFKTGKFSLQIPFKSNVQFEIPEDVFEQNQKFCDFIGVQFYGYPRIKAGFTDGTEYPGHQTKNLSLGPLGGVSFGASCKPGEQMMSFGPGFYPESLTDCLEEATQIGKPIVISETGCDARVQRFGDKEFQIDEEVQKSFFKKIMPILSRFQRNIKAFFAWTLMRGHLEWERGDFPCLGLIHCISGDNAQIESYQESPASTYLKGIFKAKEAFLSHRQAA